MKPHKMENVGAQAGISKGAGPEVPASKDSELQEKFQNRTYNPVDEAPRGNVSSTLNADSGRYKKGPGPF